MVVLLGIHFLLQLESVSQCSLLKSLAEIAFQSLNCLLSPTYWDCNCFFSECLYLIFYTSALINNKKSSFTSVPACIYFIYISRWAEFHSLVGPLFVFYTDSNICRAFKIFFQRNKETFKF